MFLFRASSRVLAIRCQRFMGGMTTCCKCLVLSILNVVLYLILNQQLLTNIQSSLSRETTSPGILATKVKQKKIYEMTQNNFIQKDFTELMAYRRSTKEQICDKLFSLEEGEKQSNHLQENVHYKGRCPNTRSGIKFVLFGKGWDNDQSHPPSGLFRDLPTV